MVSVPPTASDVLHEQRKPTTTTGQDHISSGSSLNHEDVEKIDRTPSYDKPIVAKDSAVGDVETTDVKYGTGVEEKAMSASEDESVGDGKRKSKLRTLWARYRIFGHLAIWLVFTG